MKTTVEMRDEMRESLRKYVASMPAPAQRLAKVQIKWMREQLRSQTNFVSFMEGSLMSMFDLLIDETNSRKAVAMSILIYSLAIAEEWPNGVSTDTSASIEN